MSNLNILIKHVGMINPCGIGASASAAAVRAGINCYENSDVEGLSGEPIKVAKVPDECLPEIDENGLSSQHSLYIRLFQLAQTALNQVNASGELRGAIPIFLALPEHGADQATVQYDRLLKDLNNWTECRIDLLTSRMFTQGRAAGMRALKEAVELLTTTGQEQVIVGGVDSYLDQDILTQLDQEKRLLGDASFDGFVPGEGAAFVLLEKSDLPGLTIGMPSVAVEPGHLYSESNCLGEGLTQAIGTALASSSQQGLNSPVQTVMCSLNGESHHVKEWSFALTRNSHAFAEGLQTEHPAECYGDLGAATIPSLLGLAKQGMDKNYLAHPMLVWGASDHETRGAVILSKEA